MDPHISLILCLLSALGFCSCQNELLLNGPLNGTVGGSVEFTLINPPSAPPFRIILSFSGNREDIIFTSIGGVEDIHADYVDRISVDKTTASLELRGLTLNDTGLYTVRISFISGGVESQGETSLTVFERISGAAITSTDGILIAGESSVILTCDAQGSIITRGWRKDGNPLYGVNIDELNRTVSISPVKKEDKGDYTCQVSNPVSSETVSKGLIVNYGPEKVNIMGEGAIEIGSPVHLTCTAESVPESTYTWAFNGTETSVTGASYSKEPSEYEDSGTYTCTAWNSITKHTDNAVFKLSVKAQGSLGGAGGLSDGAIAGIVIMIILVVAAGIGISIFLWKKKGSLPGDPTRRDEAVYEIPDTHTYANTMRNPELLGGPAQVTPNSAGRNPQQALRPCSRKGGDSTSSINQHQAGLDGHVYETPLPAHSFPSTVYETIIGKPE
ncbi:carcinoembryonic antigen-related cell adhesion molecule 20-like isoform X2 [Clupea harengus]|uniref:Carcinoembryonic antigen-related cell adhesion molecule 20-like isoform X2 n=1 Tax=Clupea harengus TaxID=7950 RepID=A0A6P8GCD5_CLUHA|nr:carcinoembryonic antigen-related cell adhesion molecule 20-like isoform X2 [Clupea harengus]